MEDEKIDLRDYKKVEVRTYNTKQGTVYKTKCPYCNRDITLIKGVGKAHCPYEGCGEYFWLD